MQCPDLFGDLFTVPDDVLGRHARSQLRLIHLFRADQTVDAVEGDAAVVTDDAAASVGVGQSGDDVRGTGPADSVRVDIENALVVGLAVVGEDLLHKRVDLVAVGGE